MPMWPWPYMEKGFKMLETPKQTTFELSCFISSHHSWIDIPMALGKHVSPREFTSAVMSTRTVKIDLPEPSRHTFVSFLFSFRRGKFGCQQRVNRPDTVDFLHLSTTWIFHGKHQKTALEAMIRQKQNQTRKNWCACAEIKITKFTPHNALPEIFREQSETYHANYHFTLIYLNLA